jgi:hypothetical protein
VSQHFSPQGVTTFTTEHPGRQYHTFYWHLESSDSNGNNGPAPDDGGWHAIAVRTTDPLDYDKALTCTPRSFQKLVEEKIAEYYEPDGPNHACIQCGERTCNKLSCFIPTTCMWGVGFSFMAEGDWLNELNNMDISTKYE